MSFIYEPAEDSYLLSEALERIVSDLLKENSELSVLEIGPGSGIQLEKLKELGVKNIFGADINSDAVKLCKEKGFECIESDLFENVSGKFDLILFNPPYLPKTSDEPQDSEIATTGGVQGGEIINEFLANAREHLNSEGRILLLVSSLTKGIDFSRFKKKEICKKKIFFEELRVLELKGK